MSGKHRPGANPPPTAEWETHPGITDLLVDAFLEAVHSSAPPHMRTDPHTAHWAWMIERDTPRTSTHTWVTIDTGYTHEPYWDAPTAAHDLLTQWLTWNGIADPNLRALHAIWVKPATDATWIGETR